MANTKFTPENRAVLVSQVRVGVPLTAACRDIGVRPKTAEGWLTRGRREKKGAYADFAVAIAAAREEHDRAGLTAEEYEKHLAKAVRAGSVQAMKLWWEIHGKAPKEGDDGDDQDSFDALDKGDELAKKRAGRAAR